VIVLGIDTSTATNGRQRTTIAEMTGNKSQFIQVATKDLGSTSCTVLMANAVKAVPPDPLFKPFVWTRINRRHLRHLCVKSGIEHGYLGNRTQDLLDCNDAFQIGRIMSRS
jgi:hypothetical protein